MDDFWQQARQILASGEPAVLATVMMVHRQVPQVSPRGHVSLSRRLELLVGSMEASSTAWWCRRYNPFCRHQRRSEK